MDEVIITMTEDGYEVEYKTLEGEQIAAALFKTTGGVAILSNGAIAKFEKENNDEET